MSKEIETRPQEIKQPLKMEVKTLVPWMIILIMVTFLGGVASGWIARSDQVNQIKSEVAHALQVAQAPVKK
jgi:hypothetical protein